MFDEKAEQADLIDECWQVVVQEECSLYKKIRNEVHQISEEQCEADVLKFHPFLVVQINDLSTTS